MLTENPAPGDSRTRARPRRLNGKHTRTLFLDALEQCIEAVPSWRVLTVQQVAASTAPNRSAALFWRYWPDLENAALDLVRERLQDARPLGPHLAHIALLLAYEQADTALAAVLLTSPDFSASLRFDDPLSGSGGTEETPMSGKSIRPPE